MANFALIGGSGLDQLSLLEGKVIEKIDTPYGKEPLEICRGVIDGLNIVFLSRHGTTEKKPPHMINYRANIWALAQFEPKAVIALASVGAVLPEDDIGAIAVPDQIIDYTWGRETSYNTGKEKFINFIDFTYPFDMDLREAIVDASEELDLPIIDGGTYACTQGPRLETAAEVDRIDNDGGHYVGMTLMPEACLARELNLKYAAICQIVNTAAGRGSSEKGIVLADTKEALTKATKESVDLALTTFRSLAK